MNVTRKRTTTKSKPKKNSKAAFKEAMFDEIRKDLNASVKLKKIKKVRKAKPVDERFTLIKEEMVSIMRTHNRSEHGFIENIFASAVRNLCSNSEELKKQLTQYLSKNLSKLIQDLADSIYEDMRAKDVVVE